MASSKQQPKNETAPRESLLETMAFQTARNIGSAASLVLHTVFFGGVFGLSWFGFNIEQILLILTTVVSLEAIYLAIFIQMTVNRQAEDIEDIQEEVKEIGDDVEEISEDIEDIQEDVEELSDEMDEDDKEEEVERANTNQKLRNIEATLHRLLSDIEGLKK